MKNSFLIVLLSTAALLFHGCAKEDAQDLPLSSEANEKPLLADHFSHLAMEHIPKVVISKGDALSGLSIADRKKLQLTHIRDSAWAGMIGRTSFYESSEMVVTPSNRSYIFPGSILRASSIASDEFQPLFGYGRLPIRANLSFPSSLAVGTINDPTLSESRIFLRNAIMAPDFSGYYVDDFQRTIAYFSRYEEVKLSYGYNVNERRLFSSVNSSFDHNSSSTNYATKLIVSYTVKNFTYSMPDPLANELIDISTITAETFNGFSPVFINSVTYGRYGILVVETQQNASSMENVFDKVVKKIFKQSSETFTQEEKNLFNSCRVTVHLLGSTLGESTIQLLLNPDPESMSSFMSENVGTFTAADPGVPISFTAKYLADNSLFKTTFQIDFP
ncbi:thiol-activated cytolysin family protein [Sphingobacterium griseoflavum]|uniref:Hemolysin n=1 Tax=Sphingobacterium griseoflavum TaxID=1474952 RepID=A0ABQ3HZ38_9SPHI|nr:thiol-activated cytolysin family protein [Sphingobacterium griseoflavum]GHE49372.1 hypothetical protein GCM10017764_35540 [Sphingobacterium griseoflavum]